MKNFPWTMPTLKKKHKFTVPQPLSEEIKQKRKNPHFPWQGHTCEDKYENLNGSLLLSG